ncbi:GFA family protein [Sphingoaurantiacus capsulatus]|uniref:GFA family protein n=1 Tax=Sphingoaurantiacus capsulatus TaxID=1771310 RepID=A0ABV7X9J0_9SPHN
MSEHHGSCHCGRVRLTLRDTPTEAGECNCSICRRNGGLWHYCAPAALTVEGDGVAYQQGDRALDLWHCPTCGCTTHWTPTDLAYPRVGINLRMFDPALWHDLPRRLIDGASY